MGRKNIMPGNNEPGEKTYIHSNCKRKSDFLPFIPQNDCEEAKELEDIKISKHPGNMTLKEKMAMEDLRTDETIVIKLADKGGGGGVFWIKIDTMKLC